MQSFKSLIEKLDSTLRKYNPAAYANLGDPISSEEIEGNLREIGITDENVKALFAWKMSLKDEHGPTIMPEGALMDFDLIKYTIDTNTFYDNALIELFNNFEIGLLFNIKPGPHYGKLYYRSTPELFIKYPVSCYESLPALITTVIEAYEKGAYVYDAEAGDWLEVDYEILEPIAKKHNPACVYWKSFDPLRHKEWYEI